MTQHSTPQGDEAGTAAGTPVFPDVVRDRSHDDGSCAAALFLARLGDQIDDRVAVALDEQIAERLDGPGFASRARRAALAVVCASAAAGAAVTILTPGRPATLLITWGAITVINLAYFFRRG
jgi:hypothetical protein